MAEVIEAEQAKIQISRFTQALMCRSVTNFKGDSPEKAVHFARWEWGWWDLTIEQFKAAQTAGLIVRHHRRHNKVRKGFRTLLPAERQLLEARLDGAVTGTRIPKKKRDDLSFADCQKLARRAESAHKKERLQARMPLRDLIVHPAPVLVTPKDLRTKHPKWFRHPAMDPLTV